MNTMTLTKEHVTVTVQYVNEPKGNAVSGSIKDTNGDYYGVHKSRLHDFAVGQAYEFDFSVSDSGYRNVDVKTIQPLAAARPQQRAQAHEQRQDVQRSAPVEPPKNGNGNGNGYYKSTDPKDAKRMWMCSQLNALITSRQVVISTEGIAEANRMLSDAYDQTIGQEDAAG